jgi:hypothetical protein
MRRLFALAIVSAALIMSAAGCQGSSAPSNLPTTFYPSVSASAS